MQYCPDLRCFEMLPCPNHAVLLQQLYRLSGAVVKGFGRGSKMLGFPTANLDPAAFKNTLKGVERGVYCGWASVSDGCVHKAVLSLGYNPQFQNKEETVEAYILHEFQEDFYGQNMKLLLCGFLRPMYKFPTMDDLVRAINNDCKVGSEGLDEKEMKELQFDPFFYGETELKENGVKFHGDAKRQEDGVKFHAENGMKSHHENGLKSSENKLPEETGGRKRASSVDEGK